MSRAFDLRPGWGALVGCALVWQLGGTTEPCWADATIELPPTGKGVLLVGPDDDAAEADGPEIRLALLGEVAMVAILGAEPVSGFPEIGGMTGGRPELAVARVGLQGTRDIYSYSLRIDFSEGLRTSRSQLSERPVAAIDRFIDDAALFVRPRVWARFVLGRFKVPWSRARQLERQLLTQGAVSFATDRLAPDRRWGATLYGDLGALAYALGGYADFDALEPRGPSALADGDPLADNASLDPSSGGRLLTTAYLWWTPRAPIGADHLATPASDPWYDTMRPAGGIGLMWRERAGADRIDVSIAGQIKYQRWAAIGELFGYVDDGALGLSAAGQGSVLLGRFALFARADYDHELRTWSTGGGLNYHVTADRKNKVGFVGWVRRDTQDGRKRDGALVLLQAAL